LRESVKDRFGVTDHDLGINTWIDEVHKLDPRMPDEQVDDETSFNSAFFSSLAY
jgi:hypothetical protein